ncbi:hypothetical protein FALBO_3666 [Fusarium albosuccineum]|uniref:DUF2786 domain-containing protein n=1 Tax=Fusarium albosuccineum TaxID=1237068 RepID=A0A8H4LL44_9HYPO|nr:hypothetical protein FALBO_3666 [Fusarium albosuccineum]
MPDQSRDSHQSVGELGMEECSTPNQENQQDQQSQRRTRLRTIRDFARRLDWLQQRIDHQIRSQHELSAAQGVNLQELQLLLRYLPRALRFQQEVRCRKFYEQIQNQIIDLSQEPNVSDQEVIHLRNCRPELADAPDDRLREFLKNDKMSRPQSQPPYQPQDQSQVKPQTKTQAQANAHTRPPKAGVRIHKAITTELARPNRTESRTVSIVNDGAAIRRIKSVLSHANHASTVESEAVAALQMASRLMAQHNATQAQVLANMSQTDRLRFAGHSIVAIRRSNGDCRKRVIIETYVDSLNAAITTFFNCKSHSTRVYGAVNYTFYGLANNTVAAATAFEMVYNLVNAWALEHRRRDRTGYVRGVCEALSKAAKKEAADEADRARMAEDDTTVSYTQLGAKGQLDLCDSRSATETNSVLSSPRDSGIISPAGSKDYTFSNASQHGDRVGGAVHYGAVSIDEDTRDGRKSDGENREDIDGCIEPGPNTETDASIDPLMNIDKEGHRMASATKHPFQQPGEGISTPSESPRREAAAGVRAKRYARRQGDGPIDTLPSDDRCT